MTAARGARASRATEEDDLKHAAPDKDDSSSEDLGRTSIPAVPDMHGGPLDPEAFLALQQAIGNRAVGGLVERRRTGQPLPPAARDDMEAAFGRDFGQVHVHSGPEVDQAAEAVDAAAFTTGDDIYVHSDLPDFSHPLGRQVLGEELAHVAQGVGRDGVSRITATDETAEREAHAAGLAAMAGEHAEVDRAPEAGTALARFDWSEIFKGDGEGETAATTKQTSLSDNEKDRLAAGALKPLNSLLNQLIDKRTGPLGSTLKAKSLQPLVDNARGISRFIASFGGPAAIQPTIESAATSAAAGINALLAAMDPATATQEIATDIANLAAEIDALAVAPKPTAAPGATPPTEAQADSLSPAEADQLKFGAAKPLASASEQLRGEHPDIDAILARLGGVPDVLRSFSRPAALVPQLHKKAVSVEVDVRAVEAIRDRPEVAIDTAIREWRSCIDLLRSLTAKSPVGGATANTQQAQPPASGDDEDKNEPSWWNL